VRRGQATRVDSKPGFALAAGVGKLPQPPGSGQINLIAWKFTQDGESRMCEDRA
jgi:hypothetical protein